MVLLREIQDDPSFQSGEGVHSCLQSRKTSRLLLAACGVYSLLDLVYS